MLTPELLGIVTEDNHPPLKRVATSITKSFFI